MLYRELNEHILSELLALRSAQTGFIHYCPHAKEGEKHDAVPTLENFNFVLSLLKSRSADHIQEAKRVLERLLSYQHESGNFPVYLHEFPFAYNRWQGAGLLLPLYWIYAHFHFVLGEGLKEGVKQAALRLLKHSLDVVGNHPADYVKTLKIACGLKAFGKLLQDKETAHKGEQLICDLVSLGVQPCWYCPRAAGSILSALQLVPGAWPGFWEHASSLFDPVLGTYAGPALEVFQVGRRSETTLYDLYMHLHAKSLTPKLLPTGYAVLQASLIHPIEEVVPDKSWNRLSGSIGEQSWDLIRKERVSIALVEQKVPLDGEQRKGFHPFRMLWGDAGHLSSFVFQGGNVEAVAYEVVEEGAHLFFTLGSPVDSDRPGDNREICFYISMHEHLKIAIDGVKATMFQLHDTLTVQSGSFQWELRFFLEQGEGQLVGHIMPGNRPSQTVQFNGAVPQSYDWQIFLRSVRRSPKCRVKVAITQKSVACSS